MYKSARTLGRTTDLFGSAAPPFQGPGLPERSHRLCQEGTDRSTRPAVTGVRPCGDRSGVGGGPELVSSTAFRPPIHRGSCSEVLASTEPAEENQRRCGEGGIFSCSSGCYILSRSINYCSLWVHSLVLPSGCVFSCQSSGRPQFSLILKSFSLIPKRMNLLDA